MIPYPTPIASKTYKPLSIGQIDPSARQLHRGSQPGSPGALFCVNASPVCAKRKVGKKIKTTIKIGYITGFKSRFIRGVLSLQIY